MDLELAGKVALVTGASAGIGVAIAHVMAREGVELVITARREDRLQPLADEIAAEVGRRPQVIATDLAADMAPATIARAIEAAHGRLDILVNNAGGSRQVTPEASDAEWDEAMDLKYTMGRRLTSAFLAGMRARKWGRIINITGILEPSGSNASLVGCAATHAWAKGISRDLAADGITVNCVPPGRILSEQITERIYPTEESRRAFADDHIPAGYFGEPEDLAHLVAFLASPLARYITGTVIQVDGGMQKFIQ